MFIQFTTEKILLPWHIFFTKEWIVWKGNENKVVVERSRFNYVGV
jgi:hypothetical protein